MPFSCFFYTCRLTQGTRKSVISVFCRLLDPTRGNDDATRGRIKLANFLERFTYTYVTSYFCETCCTNTDLYVTSCCMLKLAKVIVQGSLILFLTVYCDLQCQFFSVCSPKVCSFYISQFSQSIFVCELSRLFYLVLSG